MAPPTFAPLETRLNFYEMLVSMHGPEERKGPLYFRYLEMNRRLVKLRRGETLYVFISIPIVLNLTRPTEFYPPGLPMSF